MTVIAYDGISLAADKQETYGNMRMKCRKLHRINETTVIACAGSGDSAEALVAWYRNGAEPKDFPNNTDKDGDNEATLIVAKQGKKGVYAYYRNPHPTFYEGKLLAFGCGRDYALAAMTLGLDAKQAVLLANKLDVACGLGVDCEQVEKPKPKKKKR